MKFYLSFGMLVDLINTTKLDIDYNEKILPEVSAEEFYTFIFPKNTTINKSSLSDIRRGRKRIPEKLRLCSLKNMQTKIWYSENKKIRNAIEARQEQYDFLYDLYPSKNAHRSKDCVSTIEKFYFLLEKALEKKDLVYQGNTEDILLAILHKDKAALFSAYQKWNEGKKKENTSHKNDLKSQYLYRSDSSNVKFMEDILQDKNCTSIDLLSITGSFCVTGLISSLIQNRLQNKDFIFRLILPSPDNRKCLEQWYTNFRFDYFMYSLSIFKDWCERYPERFLLRFTTLPITNRLYIDHCGKKMFIDHLLIPADTNFALAELIDAASNPQMIEVYQNQFDTIWEKYSVDAMQSF